RRERRGQDRGDVGSDRRTRPPAEGDACRHGADAPGDDGRARDDDEQVSRTSQMSRPNAVSSAVVFDKVSFAFDEHVVLRDLSFSVPTGGMRILLGPSGAGKSVVLKLILGLLRPDG